MHAIYHQVGVRATIDQVYAALTDAAGIAGWWTTEVSGAPDVCDANFVLLFGDARMEMRVETLRANQQVAWRCVKAHPEWEDTVIRFDLAHDAATQQTTLDFAHENWRDNSSLFRHCATKWAVFLLSLKDLLETGEGRPHPNSVPINHS